MLRVVLLALSTLLAVPAVAEQAGGSGLPAPKNEREWKRAVQARVEANMSHLFHSKRAVGAGKAESRGILSAVIASDGTVSEVRMESATGSAPDDTSLIRAMSALPNMPPFTPDMQSQRITVRLPIKLSQ